MQIEDIRSEIERLTVEIDKLEKERARIDELINPAKRERESWQFIYSRRVAESEQVTVMTASENALMALPTEPADGYGSKSRAMRQFIMSSMELGVTPKTIQDHMRSKELPVSANFVYKTLAKMVEDGEIENKGGVFRPKTQSGIAA